MDPVVADWLSLVLRWLHVVAGAAWVGTSFYFFRLNQLRRPGQGEAAEGLTGELWSVHGGGLYHVSRHESLQGSLPETLHWFKWEAYATWLSGMSLLVLVYYLGSGAMLVAVPASGPAPASGHGGAVAIGLGAIAAGWLVYDSLCRSPLVRAPRAFAAVGFALGTAAAWGLSELLSPRAAYAHMGALLGTLMAGNVFRVIIPDQRRSVAALRAGRHADPALAAAGAVRSLHNNYLTLPVILIMVSQHYPMTYRHPASWAVLAALCLIGGVARHHFNLRARGERARWPLPSAALALVAVAWWVSARPAVSVVSVAPAGETEAAGSAGRSATFAQVNAIIERRCVSCHAAQPASELFAVPPLGVVLETPQQIRALAPRIRAFAVASHAMPLANLTEMSVEERELVGRWIERGTPLEP